MPYEVAFLGLRDAAGRFLAAKDVGIPAAAQEKSLELADALGEIYSREAPPQRYPPKPWLDEGDPRSTETPFNESIHGDVVPYVAGATGNMRGFGVAVSTDQPEIAGFIRDGRQSTLTGGRYYFLSEEGNDIAVGDVAPVAPNLWEGRAFLLAQELTGKAAKELGNSIVRECTEVSL